MSALTWDQTGDRLFETGVDHGVLYKPNDSGVYDEGYAWNGLTTVTESPTGAESNPQYADNMKYLNLQSAEEFGATIEAFTYPDAFAECDGSSEPEPGVTVGQQTRKLFGLSYRTLLGNDTQGIDYGYKLHLIYGALAAPSEKAYNTVNDSPEAVTMSWEVTTTPVEVGVINGKAHKPAASMTINSTKVDADGLAALEAALYGTEGTDPYLPSPSEVFGMFGGTLTQVTPTAPTFDSGTDTITIPTVTGVVYTIDGEVVTGAVVITEATIVTAKPAAGYKFPAVIDNDWYFSPA